MQEVNLLFCIALCHTTEREHKINMTGNVFVELSLVIALTTAISLVMRWLRQPLIIGYILTGILVGPAFLDIISQKETFQSFSEIGIALLLFIIGLELRIGVIRSLGKTVFLTAAAAIFGTGTLSFITCLLFGLEPTAALIIALALTFSSTIIIVKVLNDKRESSRLYAQITIGVLLLEDILATIALLFVTTDRSHVSITTFLELGGKALLLAIILWLAGSKLLPRVTLYIAKSQELLFLSAIAWGFGIATIFELIGFSIEVGALFAGISLASLPYTQEIAARLKPLRDFFIVLFFIVLGESLQFQHLSEALVPAVILSLVVLISKPLFVMTSLGLLGYTKRTSFKSSLPLSQISEFSIVLVVIAVSAGLVDPTASAVITLVAIITIAASTYLVHFDNALFHRWEGRLKLFERRIIKEHQQHTKTYPLVLFGYKKGGHEFIKTFQSMRQRFVVVDYNPEVIELLERQHINVLYGDATDLELLEELNADKIKLVVSTITDHAINLSLVKYITERNQKAVIICHSENYNEAAELYRAGATYVMIPHFIGSERISGFIKRNGLSKSHFDDYREKHLLSMGHTALHSKN